MISSVFLIFVPIDETNTMMYLRQYHKVRFPLIRQIFEFLAGLGNLYILNQDKRVVVTQRPARPDLGIGEVLIPGDHPIVMYRKRRRALMEEKELA
jgi:phenylpropionate dioxygenase-like ring-hydroxylating dioxygenase large terminal subunit